MQHILIIGQGLAGSILGYELKARGFDISIVDANPKSSSSKIAAGILNPITGKRLKKDKHFELFLKAAKDFYTKIESELHISCFHNHEMLRVLRNKNELKKLEKRKDDPEYTSYLKTIHKPNAFKDAYTDPFGSFELNEVYTLDTKVFLKKIHSYFSNETEYTEAVFNYQDIKIDNKKAIYKNKIYDRIIFCEGYNAKDNPWFSWLPFNPAKGEILTLRSDKNLPQQIINSKRWMVPTSDTEAKLGATYSWEPLNEITTEEGKTELLEALPTLIKQPGNIEVINHEAAVRPCTQDNHPFIGQHPQYPQLGIFNGFGTKGTLMIPLLAKQYTDSFEGGNTLLPEVYINRIPHE